MTEHKIIEHRVTASTTNVLAVISLVLSLLGVLATILIPIMPQIAAIICGHIARSQIIYGDILLLNKCDLVTDKRIDEIENQIDKLNGRIDGLNYLIKQVIK